MKITKKITSIVLALLLAVSAFAGLAITANAADLPDSVTLTIHKYAIDENDNKNTYIGNDTSNTTGDTKTDVTGTALDGVVFSYVRVCGLNEAAANNITVSGVNAASNYYQTTYNSTVTDAFTDLYETTNGTTTLTLNDQSKYGLYLVVEKSAPASVTEKSVPFFVYLPTTSADGQSFKSKVDVYPKNLITLGGATLEKTVNNKNLTADNFATPLVQYPEFQLKDSEGTVIATIEAKPGSTANVVTATTGKYATAVVTQKDGKIAVDGLPEGIYTFTESKAAIVTGTTELPKCPDKSFTITKGTNIDVVTDTTSADFGKITKQNDNDGKTVADFEIKVDNSSEPTIDKTVDKATATIGENVVWTLTPVVPDDIATYKVYRITDQIDNALDIAGPAAVKIQLSDDGTTYTDYTAVAATVVDKLVTVDFAGHFNDLVGKQLKITITTKINDNAVVDTDIENTGRLDYTNQYNHTNFSEDTDKTKTGGAKVFKYDAADKTKALENVEFALYKNDATTAIKVKETVDGTKGDYTVDPNGSATIKTDINGNVVIRGLEYTATAGTYKLRETKAAPGYQLPTADFDLTVDATTFESVLATNEYPNVKQPELPLTGGMGTTLIYVAGIALIGVGAFFFIRSRKSKKEEA